MRGSASSGMSQLDFVFDKTSCLHRPRSMTGGDLHWLWKPYALYQEIDHVCWLYRSTRCTTTYLLHSCTALRHMRIMWASRTHKVCMHYAPNSGPHWRCSCLHSAFMNVVENCFNLMYLWLAHVSGSPAAPLVGFAGACMTFSKTMLYWLQEYYCGGCSVWHNDWQTLISTWILPNLYVQVHNPQL